MEWLWGVLGPDRGEKFGLSRYRTLCSKFPCQHQCSRVASYVADWKFYRTRERHRAFVTLSPVCLRRPGWPPGLQFRIEKQERAFPRLSSFKAERAAFAIPEGDFHFPTTDQVWRLRLERANAEYLGAHDYNQCWSCSHNYRLLPIWLLAISYGLQLRSTCRLQAQLHCLMPQGNALDNAQSTRNIARHASRQKHTWHSVENAECPMVTGSRNPPQIG